MHSIRGTLILCLFVFTAGGWAADNPFAGTWKVNVAKSKYDPGPPPAKPGAVTIEPNGDNGIKVTVIAINGNGEKSVNQYSADFDGEQVPFNQTGPGAVSGQTVSLKRINDRTVERTTYLAGKKLVTEQWVISKDGKTRTNTQTGTNEKGVTVHNVIVSERQ
jgi:hypothetical protein